jgi:3-oxoacyl-[acyl-carrier protein] reductase
LPTPPDTTIPDLTGGFASLAGRRAFITGSSSGIGRAIALEFARAGADVIVHCARSVQQAELVAAEIRRLGCRCEIVVADISQPGEVERLSNVAWDRFSGLDICVNNTGADLLTGEGGELDYFTKLERLFAVDVRGTVMLSRRLGRRMRDAGAGVLINIGWDQADRGMEGDSGELFSLAKNAIMGLTRSLAVSLAPRVRVNCIAPGWIRTAWGEQAGDKWQQRVASETPLNRWGTPEDIAKLARFLASDDADYITGQVINANGGAVR